MGITITVKEEMPGAFEAESASMVRSGRWTGLTKTGKVLSIERSDRRICVDKDDVLEGIWSLALDATNLST